MRGLGLFLGGVPKRNEPIRLENPHPVDDHGEASVHSGDAGKDGYTRLSQAHPTAQGSAPPVKGTLGPAYQGPDQSFEQ